MVITKQFEKALVKGKDVKTIWECSTPTFYLINFKFYDIIYIELDV